MELLNITRMSAANAVCLGPDAREHALVVVRGTFRLPLDGSEPTLLETQLPPTEADSFLAAPGESPVVLESDFVPIKPVCDVLLNGNAYAPHGRAATQVPVSLRVGNMEKSFHVVGDRLWRGGTFRAKPSPPEPFEVMPIHYGRAYGGVDCDPSNADLVKTYQQNPVGVGFYPYADPATLDGRPLPNTEELSRPVESCRASYEPMSFGPLCRNMAERRQYAGTYDEEWQQSVFPFLPKDFNTRYYQAAPPDQQVDQLDGQPVELWNLTRRQRVRFTLPDVKVNVDFLDADGGVEECRAQADTLLLEPDEGRFSMIWRAARPLRFSVMEVREVRITSHWPRRT